MALSALLPAYLYTSRLRLDLLNYASEEHFECLMQCMNSVAAIAMMGDCGIRTADDLDSMLWETRLGLEVVPDLTSFSGEENEIILNGRGDAVVDCDCYYLIRLGFYGEEGEDGGDRGNGHLVGAISLSQRDSNDPPDIGWSMLEAFHGRGYATEAAREVLRFVMQDLHVRHIVALPNQSNVASIAVAAKLGMVDSGLVKYQAGGEVQLVYVFPE